MFNRKLKAPVIPNRTHAMVKQEYINLCAEAGDLGVRLESSTRDLAKIHERLFVLAAEGKRLELKELEEKQKTSSVEKGKAVAVKATEALKELNG